jgi:hypothetical protein
MFANTGVLYTKLQRRKAEEISSHKATEFLTHGSLVFPIHQLRYFDLCIGYLSDGTQVELERGSIIRANGREMLRRRNSTMVQKCAHQMHG